MTCCTKNTAAVGRHLAVRLRDCGVFRTADDAAGVPLSSGNGGIRYRHAAQYRIACRIPDKCSSIVRLIRWQRNIYALDPDVVKARAACTSKETIINPPVYAGNGIILYLIEIAVDLPRKRSCAIAAERRHRFRRKSHRVGKVDVIREHIVAREIAADVLKLGCIVNKLIVVVRRRCRCAVHRIGRCRRGRRCLVADMRIAVVCRIGVEDDRACCRTDRACVKNTDILAVDLDLIRRHAAHIDDIRLADCRGAERSGAARLEGSRTNRRRLLRGDVEIADVHGCRLAHEYAVRVDKIDIAAAVVDRTVDGRGTAARHDVQVIFSIIIDRLTGLDGVIVPFDDVVQCGAGDARRHRIRASNIDPCSHIVLAHRRGGCHLWNQEGSCQSCRQRIAHTP